MKKALLLTDSSVDMALSLNQWLVNQLEPIDLTIVYAYTFIQTADQPLNAVVYRQAKKTATEELNRWLNLLPESFFGPAWIGQSRLDQSSRSRFGVPAVAGARNAGPPPGPDQSRPDQLHTEILLGETELVLTIHLLLRQYDYLLIDAYQTGFVSTFNSFQHQISTQLRRLNGFEEAISSPGRTRQQVSDLPLIPTNCQLAA